MLSLRLLLFSKKNKWLFWKAKILLSLQALILRNGRNLWRCVPSESWLWPKISKRNRNELKCWRNEFTANVSSHILEGEIATNCAIWRSATSMQDKWREGPCVRAWIKRSREQREEKARREPKPYYVKALSWSQPSTQRIATGPLCSSSILNLSDSKCFFLPHFIFIRS